jgi:hypothetical protein
MKDIVAQDQDDAMFIHEGIADDKGLRDSFGPRLLGILNFEAER